MTLVVVDSLLLILDAAILTTFTANIVMGNGLKAYDINGKEADGFDIAFAGIGAFIPYLSGSAVVKIGKQVVNNLSDYYKAASKLDVGERVALFKNSAEEFAAENGLKLNKDLMKKNKGRTIYSDSKGNNYSVDTQHGAFEVTSKKGKHMGEMKFDGELNTDKLDKSGGHDLKVK